MPAERAILVPIEPVPPWVEQARRRFDPLASMVPPHVTLVFPFSSDVDVSAHLASVLADVAAFDVTLDGVTGAEGSYVFYGVKRGNDRLIELHDRLYGDVLTGFLDGERPYLPHVTVGRIGDPVAWRAALAALRETVPRTAVTVSRVVAYRRRPDGGYGVEHEVRLRVPR